MKDFIGFYYDYLSFNMDAEVVTQLMLSQQLLSGDVVLAASSDYQKNCLILEKVRAMSLQTLQSFVELLLNNDSQKHNGIMLTDAYGKWKSCITLTTVHTYISALASSFHKLFCCTKKQ